MITGYPSSALQSSKYILGMKAKFYVTQLFILLVVVLRFLSPSTADMSYFLIAGYALMGRRQIIEALFLSWFFTMVNPGLAPAPTLGGLNRYVVLACVAAAAIYYSGYLRGRHGLRSIMIGPLILGFGIIIHSILVSPLIDVSILKALTWLIAITALFYAWGNMDSNEWHQSSQFIFGGLIIIALASILLIGSSIGVLRNDSGFQGVLNHPQVFGPAMGILGTWALARSLESARPRIDLLALSALCLAFVSMSASRTAGVSSLFGIAGALMVMFFHPKRRLRAILPGLVSRRFWVVLSALVFIAILNAGKIGTSVASFITKSESSESQNLVNAYDNSRGFLLLRMYNNIIEHPILGIGFGAPSVPDSIEIERDPLFGLPFGAPNEKGVVPIMVMEELGIPFAVLIFFWVFTLVRHAASAGFSRLAVLMAVLLLNLGEAVFFSPGGQGLLVLILVAWAAASPARNGSRRV